MEPSAPHGEAVPGRRRPRTPGARLRLGTWVLGLLAGLSCSDVSRAPAARRRASPTPAAVVETCAPVPLCPAPEPGDELDLGEVPQWRRIVELLHQPAEAIDVAEVSLLMSQARDPAVDIPATLRTLDAMAAEVRRTMPARCDHRCRIRTLNRYLFRVRRFRAEEDPNGLYNNPDRDFIDRVIATRLGYCEGLSLLYLSLGRRLEIPLAGVMARQHMFVRYVGGEAPHFDIDSTRNGAPPLPDEALGNCHAAPGVFGRPLDAREMVGQIVSVVGIVDGIRGKRSWLDAAVALTPDDPDLRNNRGVERERWFDLEGALEDYHRASALDPCVVLYRTNATGVLLQQGRVDAAERELDEIDARMRRHEIEADHTFAALARGDVALERGDDAQADRHYARALEVSHRAPVALEALGIARVAQGRYADAALELLAALEADPRADTRLWFVEALARDGDHANAAIELERAARDQAPPEDVDFWRAALAEAAGRAEEATEGARRCLEEGGLRCARALVVLGDAARRRRSLTCARRYYEAYLGCAFPARDRYLRTLDAAVRQRLAALEDGAPPGAVTRVSSAR